MCVCACVCLSSVCLSPQLDCKVLEEKDSVFTSESQVSSIVLSTKQKLNKCLLNFILPPVTFLLSIPRNSAP